MTWTWVAGRVTPAMMNTNIENRLRALEAASFDIPVFKAVAAALTLGVQTYADIPLATPIADTASGWSASHPERYTAPIAGWYDVTATLGFPTAFTGRALLHLAINGTAQNDGRVLFSANTNGAGGQVDHRVHLNAGDYVTAQGWSSVSQAISAGSGDTTSGLELHWIAPY